MGRPQAYDAWLDVCEDVSLDAYLAGRRPLPHLFDLAPHKALDAEAGDIDVASLAATVRRQAEPQADVRLLVSNAELYSVAASELANTLRCDVYVPPPRAHIRYVRESSPVTGESWDAVAVDDTTGEPTPWLLIRPDERTPAVPSWFVSSRGRLRQNNGLITVPLPHGLAFATTATFRDTAALARDVTTGPPGVTTLAVAADIGRFEISRFNEASALLGGVEFATLVAASLDLIEPDLQVALTWPADAGARKALDVELMRLSDALNRTVWVPQPAGATIVADGEFSAVDEHGQPSTWYAYASRLAMHWRPSLGTDADGRLVAIEQLSAGASTTRHAARVSGSDPRPAAARATTPGAVLDPITEAVRQAELTAHRPVFMPASPTVLLATLGHTPPPPTDGHCVSWLSPSVVVNQQQVEVYVWLPPPSAHAGDWVVSSADVFLLAEADPARLADRHRSGQLLRLTAPARTAVDLSGHSDRAPETVRQRILDHGGSYLLPLAWISRYRLTGRFDVDSAGNLTARVDAAQPEFLASVLDIWFDGADHGVPGLPNEVVAWPGADLRADTPSYLVLPDAEPFDHSGFVPLTRQRPELTQGSRVLEIKVRRRRAIDVPATLHRLADLPMIGRLQEFADFDVLLSEQDFSRAVVSKVWRYGPDGEPTIDKLGGDTLSDILAASS